MKRTMTMKIVRMLATMVAPVALIVPTQSAAQITLGFGGGVTRSNVSVEPDDDFESNSSTGIFVGAFLGVPLTGVLSMTIGGVYVQKGGSFSSEFFGDTINLGAAGDYLSVPVTLQFALVSGESVDFSIFAGPTFAIETKCEVTLSVDAGTGSGPCKDGVTISDGTSSTSFTGLNTKSLDIGAVFGGVVSFPAGESARIFVSGGYDLGLTNVPEDEDIFTSAKNRAFFLGAGVTFPVGG